MGKKGHPFFFASKVQSLSNSKPLGFIKCRVVTLPDCRISWHSAVQFGPQTVANNRDNRTTGQANSINKQGWPGPCEKHWLHWPVVTAENKHSGKQTALVTDWGDIQQPLLCQPLPGSLPLLTWVTWTYIGNPPRSSNVLIKIHRTGHFLSVSLMGSKIVQIDRQILSWAWQTCKRLSSLNNSSVLHGNTRTFLE